MTIRGNIGLGVVDIGTGDTVLLNVADLVGIERVAVSVASLHNTDTVATINVTIFESPDLTSAAGKAVATLTISPSYEEDINAIIGQGYESSKLIAVADAVGTNARLSVTTYDGGD